MPDRSLHFKLFWTALIGTVVMALRLGSIAYIAYCASVMETSALVETIVKANAKEVEVELGAGFTVAESLQLRDQAGSLNRQLTHFKD